MSSAAKVGAFMLVILAILGYFALKIEDIDFRGRDTRTVQVLFDNVAGLDERSAIRVAGVRKGKVTRIQLRPDGKALVTLDIDDDVPLFENASARVANLGLLGEKYVELDSGDPRRQALRGDPIILPGSQPATIDDVTTQMSAIAGDVKAITESLRTVVSGPEGQQRVEDIVENVRTITAQVRELIAVNRVNVDATMENMRAITGDLRVEIPKIAASLDRVASQLGGTVGENREDIRKMVENLRALSADLRVTADNLNAITGGARTGEGTIGKLLTSDEAHDRLVAALGSVEKGVTELSGTLGRIGRLQLDLGMKADYYAGLSKAIEGFENLGGSSRSAISLRLVPNPEQNRFYNVELSDDPRGSREDRVTVETVTDPLGNTSTTTVRRTRFERDFLISAQAGWVLDDLSLRIGLFDSSGGIGADYRFNDRLTLTGEAFDFGGKRDDNPHLRLFGEFTIRREKPNTPRLFITSGVDNPLNDTAFTIGGGVRWRDDDLKYLLGSIPLGR
ncbi:MAG TPA: MlaD family protein [Thermoanaerobaculia bacterium]|nr:MlaD family protein [Thermoanaerobaculia bacterium]